MLLVGRSAPNRHLAGELHAASLATVEADLLTVEEELVDALTGERRFDVALLSARIVAVIAWMEAYDATAGLAIGLFGTGASAAAALAAAADQPTAVRTVVTHAGRPDLVGPSLRWVQQPTLLIVDEHDDVALQLNRRAVHDMPAEVNLEVTPDDAHQVAARARDWFSERLRSPAP